MAIGDESAYEFSLNSGLNKDKPTDPTAGDIYISTDTDVLNVCFEGGKWESQKIPIPLSVTSDGTLKFNGKTIFTTTGTAKNDIIRAPSAQFGEVIGNINAGQPWTSNKTTIISTAPTAAALSEDNILAVSAWTNTLTVLKRHVDIIASGTVLYFYYLPTARADLDDVYTNLSAALPHSSAADVRIVYYSALIIKAGL